MILKSSWSVRVPIVLILSLLCTVFTFAQQLEAKSKVLQVRQTPDFEVRGDGSADAWRTVDWTNLVARKGLRVSYQTQVKLLYSSTGIYCLFSCADRQITSTLKEDFSQLYKEDVVEIFFWPDETAPVYFEYELSPYNYELPIIVPNLNGKFFGWRPWHYEGDRLTRHAAKIIQQGGDISAWTAEIFIPYALLKPLVKEPPVKGTQWRANMYRLDYDEGVTQWSWQLTRKNFHDYEKFGTLLFE